MNTPRVVMQETKKAFRHLHKKNLEAAVTAMSNLKGVGPAMASGNPSPPHLQQNNKKQGNTYTMGRWVDFIYVIVSWLVNNNL